MLVDATTGALFRNDKIHTAPVLGVSFSWSGKLLRSVDANNESITSEVAMPQDDEQSDPEVDLERAS